MKISRVVAGALSLVACRVSDPAPPRSDARTEAPAPTRAAPEIAGPDATTTAVPVLVDLLHTVECTVAVSSKVANPTDFPEHLVDGKAGTAWNSATGDLHGWIAFRTPAVTRVKRVELTVGFDKGDLFTRNHRITRVRLSRGGVVVKEADLDPELRTLQGIDLDEAGGDFQLDVLATTPGTEKRWKELTVSELRVLGVANSAPEKPEHLPAMAIGNLDRVPQRKVGKAEPPPGPFASVKALCAAYEKVMSPIVNAAFPGDRYPGKVEGPHCAPYVETESPKAKTLVGGPFLGASVVRVNDGAMRSARLVLETKAGHALTSVTLWSGYHDDPGCGHSGEATFEDATFATEGAHEALIVRTLKTDIYWLGSPDPGGTYERAYACKVDAQGAAICEGPVVSGKSVGWPKGWNPAENKYPPVVASAVAWDMRKKPVLGPAGDLRLEP